jgi:hypothetical protein
MKTVFSNAQDCVHAFAQRQTPQGRSGNVFFYGDKIYSYGYHYLLAEFIDDFPYLKSQVMRVLESAAKLLISQERSA